MNKGASLFSCVLQHHYCCIWSWRLMTTFLYSKLWGNQLPFSIFFFPLSLHYKKPVWKICNLHYLICSTAYFLTFYNVSQVSLLVSESVPLIVRIWILFYFNLLLSFIAMLICCCLYTCFFLVLSISLNFLLAGMTACPYLRIGTTGI